MGVGQKACGFAKSQKPKANSQKLRAKSQELIADL
jgi:hypothetical protein